jgi:DNA-binding SARP family transcriptional activator
MVHLFILGRFQALIDQGPVPELEGRKVQELLAYLSLGHDRPYDREKLATLLWPDQDEAQARRYLRKVLWQLQSGLGQYGIRMLDVEPECICLRETTSLWVDATYFEQAFTAIKNVPGESLDEAQAEMLEKVSLLYRGDLLENWYLDWCLVERQRMQHIYLTITDKLMRYCIAHSRYDSGLQYGYRILAYDNAREHTHRELMALLYLSGDRTGAIRQYQHCVQILEQELGVPPAEQTQQLYEQICAGRQLATYATTEPLPPSQPRLPRLPSNQTVALLQEDIIALQELLTRFQRQLQQFIES